MTKGETATADRQGCDVPWEKAYPRELRCREEQLLSLRTEETAGKENAKTEMQVGLALSGGGLRSATFAFGFVQALAKKDALDKVDVLSTVSGGGYIGGLLSRLFARGEVHGVDDVKRAILPGGCYGGAPGAPINSIKPGSVLRWLRENGHYLAPNGGGDLLVGSAVILRNWVSVHMVLLMLLVSGFALLQALRDGTYWLAYSGDVWLLREINERLAFLVPDTVFWSPWLPLAALPAGVSALAGLWYWARLRSRNWRATPLLGALRDHRIGHRASVWLKRALLVFAVVAGVALVDAFGQTTYVVLKRDWSMFEGLRAGGVALAAVGAFLQGGRKLLAATGAGGVDAPRLPLRVTAGIVASLLFVSWLVVASTVSHAIAWGFGDVALLEVERKSAVGCGAEASGLRVACTLVGDGRSFVWSAVAFLILSIVSVGLGRCFRFLNGSTLQPLYWARLVRAYLGASNPKRIGAGAKAKVTEVIEDDDDLFAWEPTGRGEDRCPQRQFRNGAPIHLVNVAVNETMQTKTGLQRNDRRGVGMAVGPAGMSAGVRHHVVFAPGTKENASVYPQEGDGIFRMFDYKHTNGKVTYEGETLTLGQWMGISGAAFSTGLGWRTSLACSFLTGLANVRLGYWWDSGVPPRRRSAPSGGGFRLGAVFSAIFPVQSYLLDEFFARFHGVGRRRWNLSDGGHFENLGAYELIRRRLPLIVIVDAEADSGYEFEGLGQLVRKARADFDAEIEFLDLARVCEGKSNWAEAWKYVGTLDMLRRGSWRERVDACPEEDRTGTTLTFDEADRTGHSRAHAAVATVRYGCREEPESVIVYIKPTLFGNEPADIGHYHASHPDFPQQTTADQFFDEAQWESYRALGELVGTRVLTGVDPLGSIRAQVEDLSSDDP